jgi:hypothetical protein
MVEVPATNGCLQGRREAFIKKRYFCLPAGLLVINLHIGKEQGARI